MTSADPDQPARWRRDQPVSALPEAELNVKGTATLKRIEDRRRTKLTVYLRNLEPFGEYHGHLHVGVCRDRGPTTSTTRAARTIHRTSCTS